jgi:DNA-binding GntR family transcriptional regulator
VLKDWAYDRIKDDILHSRFPGGSLLKIDELAREFGISRTPIREAFLRLEQEGLIYTRPRVGSFVAEIRASDIVDIFEIRALLEGFCVEALEGLLTEEDLQELDRIIETCETAVENGHLDSFVEHDLAFHDYLIQRSPNTWLPKVMASIEDFTFWELNLAVQHLENVTASLAEHRLILEALRQGNGKLAGDLMRRHLCAIRDRHAENLPDFKEGKGRDCLHSSTS